MYYTIKIITKDSEFGLESTDKAIIEREMDLYFASIFDVSESFKSKIKNIELNQPKQTEQNNTRSINISLENSNNTQNSNTRKQTNIENTSEQIRKPENENKTDFTQEFINLATQVDNTRKNVQEVTTEKPISENINSYKPESTISGYEKNNENMISEIFNKQINKGSQNPEVNNENNQQPGVEISNSSIVNSELEKEAQKMFEQLQAKVKMDSTIQTETMESLIQKQNNSETSVNPENTVQKSETISMPQHPDIIIDEQEPEINQVIPKTKNLNTNNCEEKKLISSETNPQDNTISPFQDIIDVYNEQDKIRNMQNNKTNVSEGNEIDNSEQKTDIQENKEDKTKQPNIDNIAYSNISIESFLSGFTTDNIYDEFIICASYIKNILKQSDFTMKYINSKLFQATGKIADTSIVDELIQKEYIKNVIVDDYAKYTLTPKGEEYLASKIPS